ncbi:SMP-30/gluconolactonase/LRE family protein [Labilibacter marinus]|uniref:SMP-30/gluconolactonase/LRE family protein n=1 Tax=Labilibacter marinus TaxID=1477105 RepID=UPI00094F83D2|nr:SMP-30/gluconolactonase/LRE family protein [Labilibacter marinus]
MTKSIILSILLVVSMNLWATNKPKSDNAIPQPAKLFVELPDYCPTPDAFAIAPDGSLTLSCPNFADRTKPGVLMKITNDGKIYKLAELKGVKEGSKANPMGLAYAPDGSLYVCDPQGKNGRILRLTFKNDELQKTEVVAKGMSNPNGIRYYQGAIYVTQPKLEKFKTEKLTSGVYRFLATDRDVQVNNDSTDTNLIFISQTQNSDRQFGIDGLVFNKKGRLFVADFGDSNIYQLTLNKDGKVINQELYVDLPNTTGIDGMAIDKKGNLYLAGFSQNQILQVDKKRRTTILAQYPDNDGSNGQIDQPADLIVYGNKLVISNFDLMVQKGMINSGHSKPYTISYIDL